MKLKLILHARKVNEIKFYERGTEYLRFSIELDTKYKYGKLFAMSDFYKNLLENKYFEANIEDLIERVELFKKPEYHHLLESLIHIIQNYNNKNNPTEEDKLVLNYLLATISGIIIRKNIATQTTLESDLEKYLEDLVKDIQKWKGFKTSEIIHKIKTSREKSLKIEIEKASLIINKLEKSIESSEKILNKNFDDSLKEILKIKNSLLEEDKNLVKSKDDLQNNLKLKKFFSGLKIASKLLSVLGPKGAIIGSVAHAALEIGSQLMVDESKKKSDINSKIEVIEQIVKDYETYTEEKNRKMSKQKEKLKEKNKNNIEKAVLSIE